MSPPGTRQSPIARIRAFLNQPLHQYRPATTVFLDLNVDRVADELRLVARGKERGSQNRPTADAQTLDDIEHQIIERIEAHKQTANSIYLDHVHTYDDRVTAPELRTASMSGKPPLQSIWRGEGDRRPKAGRRSFIITPTPLRRWTYSWARQSNSDCSTGCCYCNTIAAKSCGWE